MGMDRETDREAQLDFKCDEVRWPAKMQDGDLVVNHHWKNATYYYRGEPVDPWKGAVRRFWSDFEPVQTQ